MTRSPKPGEIKRLSTERLLTLYRVACERLRDGGGWRGEPLASEWAREICCELGNRGFLDTVLEIERECKDG
jgi:hypothetical protein